MSEAAVIDASATLAWLFKERPLNDVERTLLSRGELFAPALWRLEVVNSILMKERRRIESRETCDGFLASLVKLPVRVVDAPLLGSASAIAEIAREHQLTAYDAAYLALAIETGFPLYTLDKNLTQAAKSVGHPLLLGD